MGIFTAKADRLVYECRGETVEILPWGESGIRVRATPLHAFPEDMGALVYRPESRAEIVSEDTHGWVRNGKLLCNMSARGQITFYNEKGEVLLQEYLRNRRHAKDSNKPPFAPRDYMSALDLDARWFKAIPGGNFHLTMQFEAPTEEKIYGMGQYQQPMLDLKGCTLELAHRNSQASVPFYVSSKNYGFLWNNPAVGQVTLGKNIHRWEAYSTGLLDYWLTAGDSPAEIMEAYGKVAGTVPMMPEYAMGFWQCKLRYQTQEELLSVAREYRRRGLPLCVIVIDFFHWPHQGDWRFDPEYWPDPAAMVSELKEMGVELMVSIWPTVDEQSDNFHEMDERGYLIRTERGVPISMTFMGNTLHFDATHPGAREFVWNKAKENYYKYGIKIFWLDEAEPEYRVYDFDNYRYRAGSNLEIGNIFPREYARTFYEGMEAEGQKNIINLIRCAWTGSQRYGALVWSGDIDSSFESLRNQLAAGLNMGMAGIPWWTTDIGGFHSGDPRTPEFRELLVRWFQFGVYCPVMRLHGDRVPQQKPMANYNGGRCPSGADNEVWSYGEENYPILVSCLEEREALRPYIRQVMKEAHEKGAPVIRPLFFGFPEDRAAWETEDQFLFGSDYLVAPILYAGQRERQVYLPAGAEWEEIHGNGRFSGGQTVTLPAPMKYIPVLRRVR